MLLLLVLQEARVNGMAGESMTDEVSVERGQKKRKRKSSETNPTKIRDARGLRYLLFIRQTSNLNQNRVERWRNVPVGLLLLPLITRKGGKDRTNERKK